VRKIVSHLVSFNVAMSAGESVCPTRGRAGAAVDIAQRIVQRQSEPVWAAAAIVRTAMFCITTEVPAHG